MNIHRQGGISTQSISHDTDGFFDRIAHAVERLNDWSRASVASDAENHVNGNIKFAFEYMTGGRSLIADLGHHERSSRSPNNIAPVLAKPHFPEGWKVGNLPLQNSACDTCVVSYWGQKSMLVPKIELMDEPEHFVPSRFTVWFEGFQCIEKTHAYPVGESLLYGGLKPCGGFAKRELDVAPFAVGGCEGRDDLPISMIQRGAQIVDDVARRKPGQLRL
jgi:hypothetical protein